MTILDVMRRPTRVHKFTSSTSSESLTDLVARQQDPVRDTPHLPPAGPGRNGKFSVVDHLHSGAKGKLAVKPRPDPDLKQNLAPGPVRGTWKAYMNNRYHQLVLCWIVAQVGLFATEAARWMFIIDKGSFYHQVGWSLPVTRGSAMLLTLNISILLFTVSKYLVQYLRGTRAGPYTFPLDYHIAFHKLVGHGIFVDSLVHATGWYINSTKLRAGMTPNWIQWLWTNPIGASGHLLLLVELCMYIGIKLKSRHYNIFFLSHHLYPVYIGLMLFHASWNYLPARVPGDMVIGVLWKWLLPGGLWWAIDLGLTRWNQIASTVTSVEILPERVIELKFARLPNSAPQPEPAMFVYLNIPVLSHFEWHPFTLTNAPSDAYYSVQISCTGDWTGKLYQQAAERMALNVRGPFISPVLSATTWDGPVYLFAAGIGITPFVSLLRSAALARKSHVELIWVIKKSSQFRWLTRGSPTAGVTIRLFVSRDMDEPLPRSLSGDAHIIVKYGRPDWHLLFKEIKASLDPAWGTPGLFCCGSSAIMDNVKNQARHDGFKYVREIF